MIENEDCFVHWRRFIHNLGPHLDGLPGKEGNAAMYLLGKEEAEAVRRVIESRQLFRYRGGEGGETDQFEAEWAAHLGARYCIAMSSGTAALTCALAGLGIGPGDEVIVPAYTWIATALSALTVGAIPVLAEVDASLTLDPVDVERKINARTRAILPVHICGFPCNLDRIMDLAVKHGLSVVEDACQADGGRYRGKGLGAIGSAGAHSFNQFKIMTCGEGGAMVTNDEGVFQRALVHHDAGAVFREYAGNLNVPFYAGTNYRINELLSAVLRVQLSRLEGILSSLRREKRLIIGDLSGIERFSFAPSHDVDGDCGTTVPLQFETDAEARAFVETMVERGYAVESPINSNYHVYVNWTPLLEKRGAHHPNRDPFNLCGYRVDYPKDACPKTLGHLARTVYFTTEVGRPEGELMKLIQAAREAAAASVARA